MGIDVSKLSPWAQKQIAQKILARKAVSQSAETESKYHAKKVKTADGDFDSKKEYERWRELKLMEISGVISDLKRQVSYELIPTQYEGEKCVERACTYKADFVYTQDGKTVVEDCKGYRTGEYRIKRKLMLFIHGIKVRET